MSRVASAEPIQLKHILVATDLSPASLWSVPYVMAIARVSAPRIYLAHVIPVEIYAAARLQSYDAIEREVLQHAQEKLDSFSAGIKRHGVQVLTLLSEGDVGIVISEWIKKHSIDLVAVGTTGRSGVRKLVLGSMAEEIVRDAECPVLTVGSSSSGKFSVKVRSILFATDFSTHSFRAASYAFWIAKHCGARIVALHVFDDRATTRSKGSVAEKLREINPGDSTSGVDFETLIAEGKPATKILEIANEHSVDLIVIGVRGAGGLSRAASHFGSTAHDIIVGASCPVLSVRAPEQ